MREKVLSLAKGNFTYETPELILTPDRLAFDVIEGEKKSVSFGLKNRRATVIKGFGSTDDPHISFLPVFHAAENELTVEVDARELAAGKCLKGQLYLVTDCGEEQLPYQINVVPAVLQDEYGEIRDYADIRKRIERDPKEAVALFHSPSFRRQFLYRDEMGKRLYDHLVHKNNKQQSMEEFLVAMGKKDAVRFQIIHPASGSRKEIEYALNQKDIEDVVEIKINTWGNVAIRISSTEDFIRPATDIIHTSEFQADGKATIPFTVCADLVGEGKRTGSLVFESRYEKKEIEISAWDEKTKEQIHDKLDIHAQGVQLYRAYLTLLEKPDESEQLKEWIHEKGELIDQICVGYELAVHGYLSVKLGEKEKLLDFYREAQDLPMPSVGDDSQKVENYLLVQYVQYKASQRQEERERICRLMDVYESQGYDSVVFFLLRLRLDERYQSAEKKAEDISLKIQEGNNSPILYSELMRVYIEEPSVVTSLDPAVVCAIQYGVRHGMMTREIAMTVSVLTQRMMTWDSLAFGMLEQLYKEYGLVETLYSICGMLIRAQKREKKYHSWFKLGIKEKLRITELYEYYMYTIDFETTFSLPDSVLSYFQYENHLNDTCKAFLYSYVIKKKKERPDLYAMYQEEIHTFAMEQISYHRVSEDIAVLYEELFRPETMDETIAGHLPSVMFHYRLTCHAPQIESVVVLHREMREKLVYPLHNQQAMIQIFTPNYQLFFVDRDGHYLAGTVDYTLTRILHLDELAQSCYEMGSQNVHLLVFLAVKAMRSVRMTPEQAGTLHRLMQLECLSDFDQSRLLLCLFDYYSQTRESSYLLEVLDHIIPEKMPKDKLGKIATAYIYRGMYDKAYKILLKYGTEGCETKALAMLTAQQIQQRQGEFIPILMKWSYKLYQEKCYDKGIMDYLLKYYMGSTQALTQIFKKCMSILPSQIGDGSKERLLGQVIFTGKNPGGYEEIFSDYYENGSNRMLVKAFLSYYAYEYLVEHLVDLKEEIFVKIEKEAFYVQEKIMVLATLKRYSKEGNYAKKQEEFIVRHLEDCVADGLILSFMKRFVGKVTVPHEIEDTLLIEHYSGTDKEVFLHMREGDKEEVVVPMEQVFDGIYTKKICLFAGEQRTCFVEEEETSNRTKPVTVKPGEGKSRSQGYFNMVNQMIRANEKGDEKTYHELRQTYEKTRQTAAKLFTIE